jgi:hypothetical protein
MGFSPGNIPTGDHGQRWTAEAQGHMRKAELARRGGGDPGHRPPKRPSLVRRVVYRIRHRRAHPGYES